MDTLPIEIIEMIVQLLAPQDLALCSAVSRKWRGICNQDRMWKPHCDPELEEPLRTTPCVATPAFDVPEAENSTLSPISHWKLAFMRENHLWKNWRRKNIMKKEKINSDLVGKQLDFLTDTLVVAWYSDRIEILDVSVMPATLVAKTDISVDIKGSKYYILSETCEKWTLLAKKYYSIKVFNVDIINKSIKLRHNINLDCIVKEYGTYVKEDFYLYWNFERSKLIIIDINSGKIVKEEPSPVDLNETIKFGGISGSPTCDFIVVTFVEVNITAKSEYRKYYIYSLKELTFLPGPVAVRFRSWKTDCDYVSLHGHWLALTSYEQITIIDIQTQEIIQNFEVNLNCKASFYNIYSSEFGNSFVFCSSDEVKSWVKYYSPVDRSLSTLYEISHDKIFSVINNKCIAIHSIYNNIVVPERLLVVSGQTVEMCDLSVESCQTVEIRHLSVESKEMVQMCDLSVESCQTIEIDELSVESKEMVQMCDLSVESKEMVQMCDLSVESYQTVEIRHLSVESEINRSFTKVLHSKWEEGEMKFYVTCFW